MKQGLIQISWILAFILCLSPLICAETASSENVSFSQCGINSLYVCLKYHKIVARLDDVYAGIKADADNNVSLKQLADFAKNKGLYVHPVLKPLIKDATKFLTKNNSIIIQYRYNLDIPKTQLSHIAALVKPDRKIFLLDYPKSAREIDSGKLAMILSKSDGMLVLSTKPVTANLAEFFNGKSLKSWSFYFVCAGFIISGIYIMNLKKAKKATKV